MAVKTTRIALWLVAFLVLGCPWRVVIAQQQVAVAIADAPATCIGDNCGPGITDEVVAPVVPESDLALELPAAEYQPSGFMDPALFLAAVGSNEGGIYDMKCLTRGKKSDCAHVDQYVKVHRLLALDGGVFTGEKGNTYTPWGPGDTYYPSLSSAPQLQPAGYNTRLTLDSSLMAYVVRDLHVAYNAWKEKTRQNVNDLKTLNTMLASHVEALGATAGSMRTGFGTRQRLEIPPGLCPADMANPKFGCATIAWMSFTVENATSATHFVVHSGEITATGLMRIVTKLTVSSEFHGLADLANGASIEHVDVPVIWWTHCFNEIYGNVLSRISEERKRIRAGNRKFQIILAGYSKGSGMSHYLHLKLESLARAEALTNEEKIKWPDLDGSQQDRADLVPQGKYLFAAEKPGDKKLVQLLTLLDPVTPDLQGMITHVWGNLEDALLMYPPVDHGQMVHLQKPFAREHCELLEESDIEGPDPTHHNSTVFHQLPAAYWWRLVAPNGFLYRSRDCSGCKGCTCSIKYNTSVPIYCLSGERLAYAGDSSAKAPLGSPDGYADTTSDNHDDRMQTKWMCPWIPYPWINDKVDKDKFDWSQPAVQQCLDNIAWMDHFDTFAALMSCGREAAASIYPSTKSVKSKVQPPADWHKCIPVMMNCLQDYDWESMFSPGARPPKGGSALQGPDM